MPTDQPSITRAESFIQHILAKRRISLPKLPALCVISYSRNLLERITSERAREVVNFGCYAPAELHVVETDGQPRFAVIQGQPGAPMAAVLLEELIALGFTRFLAVGAAGQPAGARVNGSRDPIGKIVLPTEAYIFEGTSQHYTPDATVSLADEPSRLALKRVLTEQGLAHVDGPVATTDALYRETQGFVRQLLERKVAAIDMEMSALFTVAQFHNKPLTGLLYISDVVDAQDDWQVSMLDERLEALERKLADTVLAFADSL